ncbi:MAG TPA: hypothetical protein VKA46_27645 [Gemmataceae bacterium]|nr:hypothetical protein [Gemmataceae bacterium]
MDLFPFIGWVVAVVCLVTLAFPLNVPLMALAYKVRHGSEPLEVEGSELWTRSALASAGPAGLSLVLLLLAYALVQGAELPRGITLVVLLLAYLPAAVAYVTWCWGYDEFVDGLSVFLIYVLLPGLPLLLIGWLAGLSKTLAEKAPWLLTPPSS